MHLFEVAFYTAGTLYALFCEQILIFFFLVVVGAYLAISALMPGAQAVGVRKKIMMGTWSEPSEGIIMNKMKVRVDKLLDFLQTLPKENRPTLTHYVIRGIGEMLQQCPDVNGKLVFGKFVPYKTADVTCLVDIDNGKDLAMVLVEDCANKGAEDIAKFIKDKASKIKSSKGDADHKKRTGPAKILPSFLMNVLLKMTFFLHHCLGLKLKAFSIKPNMFGAACLTSVGMIGFEDATAPFTGFTGCTFFAALNAVKEEPVVENGKIAVGRVVNINFAADHRYIDGGRCKNLIPCFLRTFEHPEEYLKSSNTTKEQPKENESQPLLKKED